jgi:hypothetical protein
MLKKFNTNNIMDNSIKTYRSRGHSNLHTKRSGIKSNLLSIRNSILNSCSFSRKDARLRKGKKGKSCWSIGNRPNNINNKKKRKFINNRSACHRSTKKCTMWQKS